MTDTAELPLDELIASIAVDVPDYPEPGVLFRDLTPVFADGAAFRRVVDGLASPSLSDPRAAALAEGDVHPADDPGFDVVVGVEARGFLLAAAVAYEAGVGVVLVRKAGKLPRERMAADYSLEYGTATLELHTDSLRPGQRVLVVDDDAKAVEMIALRIESMGHTMLRASGGREAIDVARRELPDLIVLDLMMPDVSGFEVAEALDLEPATASIPILVVSAKRLTEEDRARLDGYVTGIVGKAGFDGERFTGAVRRALSGRAAVA